MDIEKGNQFDHFFNFHKLTYIAIGINFLIFTKKIHRSEKKMLQRKSPVSRRLSLTEDPGNIVKNQSRNMRFG